MATSPEELRIKSILHDHLSAALEDVYEPEDHQLGYFSDNLTDLCVEAVYNCLMVAKDINEFRERETA